MLNLVGRTYGVKDESAATGKHKRADVRRMRCLTAARVLKHNSTCAVKTIDGRDGGMDAARRGEETARLEIRAQETAASSTALQFSC